MPVVQMLLNTTLYNINLWQAQSEDEGDLTHYHMEKSYFESTDDIYE